MAPAAQTLPRVTVLRSHTCPLHTSHARVAAVGPARPSDCPLERVSLHSKDKALEDNKISRQTFIERLLCAGRCPRG